MGWVSRSSKKPGWRWSVGIASIAALAPQPAAAAFNRATCDASGHNTVVPVAIGALEFDRKPQGIPATFNNYNHNTRSSWVVIANGNVEFIWPYLNYFVTDGTDALRVYDSSPSSPWTYAGTINTTQNLVFGWADFEPWTHWSGAFNQLDVTWESNASGAIYPPPSIGEFRVECRSNQNTTATNGYAIPGGNRRTDGILLKTGDVIYTRVTQMANTPMVLTLETKAPAAGSDFDLYASSTSSTPDATAPWKSTSSSGSEALNIPSLTSNRTIYIGIRSYSGAGHFTLNTYSQGPLQRMTVSVCPISFTPNAAEQNTIRTLLRRASARLLTASNGNQFISSFLVYPSQSTCGSGCGVCPEGSPHRAGKNARVGESIGSRRVRRA